MISDTWYEAMIIPPLCLHFVHTRNQKECGELAT